MPRSLEALFALLFLGKTPKNVSIYPSPLYLCLTLSLSLLFITWKAEDHKFETTVGYIERPCLKKKYWTTKIFLQKFVM
jgi:hypothetical protein